MDSLTLKPLKTGSWAIILSCAQQGMAVYCDGLKKGVFINDET